MSQQGRRIDQTHKREAADGPCVVSMTSLNLPEKMNELSDGVIRPFNATMEGRRGSISGILDYSLRAVPAGRDYTPKEVRP